MPRPSIGIGVIVMKDNQVLLGKRKNSHGEGSWGFPGGHLEMGEAWEQCAEREIMEEAGITIAHCRFGAVTNDIFSPDKHYITIFMLAEYGSGTVTNCEPEKLERWEWFAWDNLPTPLFLPIQNLLKQHFNPFEHT